MKPRWSIVAALIVARGVDAQRVIESHRWSDDEGRLMGYYAAALTFTPLAARLTSRGGLELGLELAFIPPLSEAHRTAGESKTESTNLTPIAPRPRLAYVLPWGVIGEVSWIPPLEAFGIKANLVSVAFEKPMAEWRGITLGPRVAGSTGSVEAAITCNDDLAKSTEANRIYYEYVCYGRESKDRFLPSALTGELVARGTMKGGRLRPYAGAGVRWEHTQFEVNVFQSEGVTDQRHPTLDLHVARPYGFVGAGWSRGGRAGVNGEFFYAPGSLATFRVTASWLVSRGSGE
jgi:hypothetical protein